MRPSRSPACLYQRTGLRGKSAVLNRWRGLGPVLTPPIAAPSMEFEDFRPPMPTIDEELGQLERDIRQLKIEYDQYFGGGRKRPPTEIEWRIELVIKRYSERGGELKYGQRFRYNNLTQTYAKYKDIFRKRTQQKEEGRSQRHFGAAAKAIEAERAKHAQPGAAAVESASPSHPATPAQRVSGAAPPQSQPAAFRMVCCEPENEGEKVDQLFRAFLNAKTLAGEETSKLSPAGFKEFVRKKTKDLQEKQNCRDVEYVIETIDGQVKLKALVKA
jgi:hypothetical protein